ncbi:hypothetical protein [Mycoplasma crocodyli]|uniref:Putative lipoprotein n=1 Tax=Mycoplasma crocodyli (strain ATCC 51981 / MP145) TaxID=512564 RepID=D5E5V7_MYCCM|nr:hypothetical protein [Mycoplasma crocodyli]ADE19919.1 putative lipoprotein [Mycoplasma crocodyli MP145]
MKKKLLFLSISPLFGLPVAIMSCNNGNNEKVLSEVDRNSQKLLMKLDEDIKEVNKTKFNKEEYTTGSKKVLNQLFEKVIGIDLNEKQSINSLDKGFDEFKEVVGKEVIAAKFAELDDLIDEDFIHLIKHAKDVFIEVFKDSKNWNFKLTNLNKAINNINNNVVIKNEEWVETLKKTNHFGIETIFNVKYYEDNQKSGSNHEHLPNVGHGHDEHVHVMGNMLIELNNLYSNLFIKKDVLKMINEFKKATYTDDQKIKEALNKLETKLLEFKEWCTKSKLDIFLQEEGLDFKKSYENLEKTINQIAALRNLKLN